MNKTTTCYRTLYCVCSILFAVATAFGGNVINVKPEPSQDGYYEIGFEPTTDKGNVGNHSTYAANFGYVDWDALGFAEGDKVRIVGNVLLDKLPTDLTYDWSRNKKLVFIKSDVVPAGSSFTVPEGMTFCYSCGSVKKSGDTYTFSPGTGYDNSALKCDLVIDGTAVVRQTEINPDYRNDPMGTVYSGAISGSGQITISVFWAHLKFTGTLTGDLKLVCGGSQNGAYYSIQTTNADPSIKSLTLAASSASNMQYLEFAPKCAQPASLTIGTLTTSSAGDRLYVSEGNSIGVGVHMSGNVDLRGVSGSGCGDVSFGTFSYTADNCQINVKQNVGVAVDTFHWQHSNTVDYRSFTEALNTKTLDFSKSEGHAAVSIFGKDPTTLPRKILCRANMTSTVSLSISENAWTFPIDLAATAADEVNPNRCEGVGSLSVPATGSIDISNVTDGEVAFPDKWTEYPLMTCSSGGQALSDWQIGFSGNWPTQLQKRIEVRSTGLYLLLKKQKGLMLLFR